MKGIEQILEEYNNFTAMMQEEDFISLEGFEYKSMDIEYKGEVISFSVDEDTRRSLYWLLVDSGVKLMQGLKELIKSLIQTHCLLMLRFPKLLEGNLEYYDTILFLKKSEEVEIKSEFGKLPISPKMKNLIADILIEKIRKNEDEIREDAAQIKEVLGRKESCQAGEIVDLWDNSLEIMGVDKKMDRYCIIGEILRLFELFPINERVWNDKDKKDKFDAVKGWRKAYEKERESRFKQ